MSLSVSIQEVTTHFPTYLAQVEQGEDIIITRFGEPLAKLSAIISDNNQRRLGGGRGVVKKMSEDFDSEIDDMKDYM